MTFALITRRTGAAAVLLITCTATSGFAAVITPAKVAQSIADLRGSTSRLIELQECERIGFTVTTDLAKLKDTVVTQSDVLYAAGMSTEEIVAEVGGKPAAFDVNSDDAGNLSWWQAADAAFPAVQSHCDALADDTKTAPVVERAGYQAQAGAKTYFDSVAFTAEQGQP